MTNLIFPWKRYGLIVRLAEKVNGRCSQFGKTMLQKLIYLLQDLYRIDCGYSFSLYTYGPFSPQILQDLDLVETLKGVNVVSVSSRTGGYSISPGEKREVFTEKAKDFLDDPSVNEAIEKLVLDFAPCNAKELELRSTVIYVFNELQKSGKAKREAVIKAVHDIKPHFSESDIRNAEMQLESKKYLAIST